MRISALFVLVVVALVGVGCGGGGGSSASGTDTQTPTLTGVTPSTASPASAVTVAGSHLASVETDEIYGQFSANGETYETLATSVGPDCMFRGKPITHSDGKRSLVPMESDHGFRRKAITEVWASRTLRLAASG